VKPTTSTSHAAPGESGALSSVDAVKPLLPTTDGNSVFDSPTPTGESPVPHATSFKDLKIDGYEIIGMIGQGGMGAVLEARQISLSRRTAIKVLMPELASRSDIVERFDREAATLARLMHPNIVTILERGRSGEHDYFIMEFVEGPDGGAPRDLRQLIRSHGLDERATQRLMCQIAGALGFAHSQGVTHRDVKPSNIILDRHGNAKVADFGIASGGLPGGGNLTVALSSLGTPDYMAPEQRRDAAHVDHRADIYAAGVMLYEMLTGELPLGVFSPPSQVSGVSQDWDMIVTRAMNPRPELRWPNMDEFRHAVEQVRVSGAVTSATSSQPTPAPAPSTKAPGPVTEIDGLLKAAKTHFEFAQADGDLLERFEHAEQAGLILARVLKTNASDEFQQLLADVNRLGITIARQGIKKALAEKRSSAAVAYLGWLIDRDPASRDHATKILQQIQQTRDTALSEAKMLMEGGDIQTAINRLNEVRDQFPDDPELEALTQTCRNHVEALREFREVRFPQLRDERRFFELSQEVIRLREVWPVHNSLDKLAEQVATRVAKADQLVKHAQQFRTDDRLDEALKKAQNAVELVADHPVALPLVAEMSAGSSQLEELVVDVGRLVEQHHWFTAQRKLRAGEAKGLRSPRLEILTSGVTAGCDAANRHRAFLGLVFVGAGLSVLSGKLALVFCNGLFERSSWSSYRSAAEFGVQLLFEWASLIGLMALLGRPISRTQVLLCLPLMAGTMAIATLEGSAWGPLLIVLYLLLFLILPFAFGVGITSAGLWSWRSFRIFVGTVFALLALVACVALAEYSAPMDRQRTSILAAVVVSSLLAVFGLSLKWWRVISILAAGYVTDVMAIGAERSGLDWYWEYRMWFAGLLIGVAAMICCGKLTRRNIFGVVGCVLFAFGLIAVLKNFDVNSPAEFMAVIWFCVCGSVAAQCRDDFDFGWHFRDRLGL